MIDEKKLIEEITAFGERMTKNGMQGDFHLKIIKAVTDIIAKQPKVGEWITCSERLPNFSPNKWQKVFVTLEDLNGKRFVTTAKYQEEFKWWYAFNNSRYYDFKVIAWMDKPLPYMD